MSTLAEFSNDQLAAEIVSWAGRIAAGEAHLIALIGEFDRREAWAGPGLLSCAHWLSWRTGLGPGAARERVRVAKRLGELPAVAAAFAAGQMSWSQVRAVTRVAEPTDGVDWVDLARHASGAQLERIVRGIRRVQVVRESELDPGRAAYRMQTRTSYDSDGLMVIRLRVTPEDGAVILAGLAAQREDLERRRNETPQLTTQNPDVPAGTRDDEDVPAGTPGVPDVTDADALREMAAAALDRLRERHPERHRRARTCLTAQVDPISGWGRLRDGEILPPSSLRTVLCSLPGREGPPRLRPLAATDLTRHDLGRSTRQPSLALRELLGTLDGQRCRFPGCTRRHNLHAHHIVYWSHGGSTDLDNLVLVCSRHHTLVHAQGFQLKLRPGRRLDVRTRDGVRVLHHPALPWDDPTRLPQTTALDVDPTTARMDLDYVVSVLLQQAA